MRNKLLLVTSFCLGISLPLQTKLANLFVILFCVVSLIYIIKNKKFKFQKKALFFSTLLLFFLALIGIPWAEDINIAFQHVGRRVMYLLFPIILIFLDENDLKSIKSNALYGIIIGCIASGTYLLGLNLNKFLTENNYTLNSDLFNYHYTYHNFTAPLKFHPTYIGSYFLIALIASLDEIRKRFNTKNLIQYGLIVAYLLLILLFINSRVILGLAAFSFVVYGFIAARYLIQNHIKWFVIFTAMVLVSASVAFSFIKKTYIYYRFTNELFWEASSQKNTKINEDNGGDSRIARWESISNLIAQKPILGHGTGNEKEILHAQFLKDDLIFSADSRYDSHNTYLSYGVQFGWIGILGLIFYLLSNFWISLRSKDLIYSLITLSLMSIFIFENYINNNAGILVIAFFMNVFLFLNFKNVNE